MTPTTSNARIYSIVFALLLILLGLTLAADRWAAPEWRDVLAFGLAGLKATLVGWYFMHLAYARPLTRIFALSGLVWLFLLFLFTLTDVLTRNGF